MAKTTQWDTVLSSESVDLCSEKINAFLTRLKLSRKEIARHTLAVEEILLDNLSQGLAGAPLTLITGKQLLRPVIIIELAGKPLNVCPAQQKSQSVVEREILSHLGVAPEYTYVEGQNRYTLRLKNKSTNPVVPLLITLGLSMLIGLLGTLLPAELCTELTDVVLTPVNDAMRRFLSCVAGPVVFLSILWGIYGIGDAATLKRIGAKTLAHQVLTMCAAILPICILMIPLFKLNFSGAAGGGSGAGDVLKMLLDIIPSDIVSPFLSGNILQIVLIAVLLGIALLLLGQRVSGIAKAVGQLNSIVRLLVGVLDKVMPLLIFTGLVPLFWSNSVAELLPVVKDIFVIIGSYVVYLTIILIYSGIRLRVSPILLLKKGLPTMLIAFATAASSASFSTSLEALQKKYGVEESMASFSLPLGVATYHPSVVVLLSCTAFFYAEYVHLPVSPAWIVIALLMSLILSFSIPPIPGGSLAVYTVLFSTLGLPMEYMALVVACDALTDFFCTALDQTTLPLILTTQANKMGLVDRTILKKP